MFPKFHQIIFLVLFFEHLKVDSASFYSSANFLNNFKPSIKNYRDGFAQVSIWGNSSSKPTILNSSNLSEVANDPLDESILPPVGFTSDFGIIRPMKAYQKFKNFNLRLGHFFHIQGTRAVYHQQIFH